MERHHLELSQKYDESKETLQEADINFGSGMSGFAREKYTGFRDLMEEAVSSLYALKGYVQN